MAADYIVTVKVRGTTVSWTKNCSVMESADLLIKQCELAA